jgi:hypothetical protein
MTTAIIGAGRQGVRIDRTLDPGLASDGEEGDAVFVSATSTKAHPPQDRRILRLDVGDDATR